MSDFISYGRARVLLILTLALFLFSALARAEPVRDAIVAREKGDDLTAVKLLRPMAERGDVNAQEELGEIYENGSEQIRQDYAQAMRWFKRAADRGDSLAELRISTMYSSGKGVKRDAAEAAKWLHMSAEEGGAPAQDLLASKYERESNFVEAYFWYSLAAKSGNISEATVSRDRCGHILDPKQKVVEDVRLAKWRPTGYLRLEKALRPLADKGDKNAQLKLGEAALDIGDYRIALLRLDPLAAKGNAQAQLSIGSMYFYGHGVKEDQVRAMKWLRKSAGQGNAKALHWLGEIYASGQAGVKQSYEEAYFWALLEDPTRKHAYEDHLTLDQVAAVRSRANEWRRRHSEITLGSSQSQ